MHRLVELSGPEGDALLELLVHLLQLDHHLVVPAFEQAVASRGLKRLFQLLGLPRLEDVTEDLAAVDGVDRVFQLRVAGHEQTNGLGMVDADPLEQLDAVHARHLLVGKDDIDAIGGEELLRSFAGAGRQDFVVGSSQQIRQGGEDVRFIIDHQYGAHKLAHEPALGALGRERPSWGNGVYEE